MGFWRDLLRSLNSPCRDQMAAASRRLDDDLPAGLNAGLRMHLALCGKCARAARQLAALHQAARLPDAAADLPPAVRERLLSRIREAP